MCSRRRRLIGDQSTPRVRIGRVSFVGASTLRSVTRTRVHERVPCYVAVCALCVCVARTRCVTRVELINIINGPPSFLPVTFVCTEVRYCSRVRFPSAR